MPAEEALATPSSRRLFVLEQQPRVDRGAARLRERKTCAYLLLAGHLLNAPAQVWVDGADGFTTEQRLFWECVYVDRDFYVQVAADGDETVVAYSVTARNKRFHPRFVSPGGRYVEPGLVRRALRLGARSEPYFWRTPGRLATELDWPPGIRRRMGRSHNRHYHEGPLPRKSRELSDVCVRHQRRRCEGVGGRDGRPALSARRDLGATVATPGAEFDDEPGIQVDKELDEEALVKAIQEAPEPTDEKIFTTRQDSWSFAGAPGSTRTR